MKKIILLLFPLLVSYSIQSQKIKSVEELNFLSVTKEDYESYDNFFKVNKLITDFGTFQNGDELLINRPSDGNLLRFSFIAIGKYSLLNAMAMIMFPSSIANTQIVVENLRVYKPIMGQPAIVIVDFKNKDGSISGGLYNFENTHVNPIRIVGNIFNLESAIATGEIVNPNAPLN